MPVKDKSRPEERPRRTRAGARNLGSWVLGSCAGTITCPCGESRLRRRSGFVLSSSLAAILPLFLLFPGCRSLGYGLTEADYLAVAEPFAKAVMEQDFLAAWHLGSNHLKIRFSNVQNFRNVHLAMRAQAGEPSSWATKILYTGRDQLDKAPVPESIPPKLRRAWIQTQIVTAEGPEGEVLECLDLNFLLVEELGSLRVAYFEYLPCQVEDDAEDLESPED